MQPKKPGKDSLRLFPQLSFVDFKILWPSSPEQPLWALRQLPETNTEKVFASFSTGSYLSSSNSLFIYPSICLSIYASSI